MINKLRIASYTNVESTLASLSNIELEALLEQAEPHHSGIGGDSSTVQLNGVNSDNKCNAHGA